MPPHKNSPPTGSATPSGNKGDRREAKYQQTRARSLVETARKLLRKRRGVLSVATTRTVEEACAVVDEALSRFESKSASASDIERLGQHGDALDKVMREHLQYSPKSAAREYAESIGVALLIALIIRAFFVEAFKIPTGSMIPTLEINDHIFVNKSSYGVRIPFVGKYAFSWGFPERGEVIVFEFPGKGEDHGKDYIKRVVAVQGDKIRLENHRLIVNGAPVDSRLAAEAATCNDQAGATDGTGFLSGCGGGAPYRPSPMDRCRCDLVEETVGDITYRTQHRLGEAFCRTTPDWPTEQAQRIDAAGEYFGAADSNPNWPDVQIPEGHVFVMGDNRDNSRDGRFWGVVPFDNIKGRAFIIWWATEKGRIFDAVK